MLITLSNVQLSLTLKRSKGSFEQHRKTAGRTVINIHICRRVSGRDLTHVIARTCRLLEKKKRRKKRKKKKKKKQFRQKRRSAIHPTGDFFIC